MSKIIKFRVWDTKNKKWLEEIPPEEYMLDSDDWSHPQDGDMASMIYPSNLCPDFDGRLIWQQFSGLIDKNKKEIYEGDIIKETWKENSPYGYCPDEWDEKEIVYAVRYLPPHFVFDSPTSHEQYCIEDWTQTVIGNIFENPELLK